MVDYEIKYTNRKTLAIYITKEARVEVRLTSVYAKRILNGLSVKKKSG